MDHGTKNEENGVATIVGKILPVLEPQLKFYEEGCITINTPEKDNFMVISPDGSLRKDADLNNTVVAIEIKCPVRSIHTSLPPRYLLQCLSEIEALCVDYLLFISWTEEETAVFRIDRNKDLFKKAMSIAIALYGGEKPKRPLKITEAQKQLKAEIILKSKEVHLIGRFKSCKCSKREVLFDKDKLTIEDLDSALEDINDITQCFYDLNRERATEAVAFLVADLNRSWNKDTIRCAPVAWFPKGYSLNSDTMRAIAEHVHTECHTNGIHIPCSSFDGQWHTLMNRSKEGKPLTILQLQKDLWHEVGQKKKKDIVNELKELNKAPKWKLTKKVTDIGQISIIEATNNGLRLPKYKAAKQTKTAVGSLVTAEQNTNEENVARAEKSQVLDGTNLTDAVEEEILSCNIDEREWAEEFVEIQNDGNAIEINDTSSGTTSNADRELNISGANKGLDNLNSMSMEDTERILLMFKTTKGCNKGGKWNLILPDGLMAFFKSTENLCKLLDTELRVVVRYLKKTKNLKAMESSPKMEKVCAIASWLQLNFEGTVRNKTTTSFVKRQVRKLSELSLTVISKSYSKYELNILQAEYEWPEYQKQWLQDTNSVRINGQPFQWFYKPDFSQERRQFEVRCIDSTHLMTRTRRKACKGGLDSLEKDSWMKVAKSGKTLLTPIMIEEITDPMSITMATTHFSEAVETTMRGNGDIESADLCKDIRQWWDAEDSPGLSANDRHFLRLGLRQRLLSAVDFSSFPPATMYIRGWPLQLWEALIASVDAKAWLHSLCHGGSYNVRAFSSMIGETFFAELTLNDKRGHGTVSCKEFGEFIGNTVEQVQIRLDPERRFSYVTSQSTVYNLVGKASETFHEPCGRCPVCKDSQLALPVNIMLKDHEFDSKERARLAGKKKHGTVARDRNSLMKGTLGVRWEKARTNQAKMLPTKRMGIDN